ncbi:MAG: hypothetical protein GEV08_22715 [Acidimicrobiia bacterium]|nr:hypothetical protein [Acidimicrobiia bacterium]
MSVPSPPGPPASGPRSSEEAGNPLWLARARLGDGEPVDQLIATYAFVVPTDEALRAIAAASPRGVVEVGAGTGYWAHLLREQGVDVVAYDIAPAPSPRNQWFAGSTPWFPVRDGDHTVVGDHGARTLLLVWPTRNEDWPGEAVTLFAAAGGTTVAHVGERPGGHTGDGRFHALLGEVDRCWACAYQTPSVPCVCGVRPRFRRVRTVELPSLPGRDDDLGLYARDPDAQPLRPNPRRLRPRQRRPGPRLRWRGAPPAHGRE